MARMISCATLVLGFVFFSPGSAVRTDDQDHGASPKTCCCRTRKPGACKSNNKNILYQEEESGVVFNDYIPDSGAPGQCCVMKAKASCPSWSGYTERKTDLCVRKGAAGDHVARVVSRNDALNEGLDEQADKSDDEQEEEEETTTTTTATTTTRGTEGLYMYFEDGAFKTKASNTGPLPLMGDEDKLVWFTVPEGTWGKFKFETPKKNGDAKYKGLPDCFQSQHAKCLKAVKDFIVDARKVRTDRVDLSWNDNFPFRIVFVGTDRRAFNGQPNVAYNLKELSAVAVLAKNSGQFKTEDSVVKYEQGQFEHAVEHIAGVGNAIGVAEFDFKPGREEKIMNMEKKDVLRLGEDPLKEE